MQTGAQIRKCHERRTAPANFVQSEAEFAASFDERKTPELFVRKYAMTAFTSRRFRHDADPFIISDCFDIDARSPGQLADKEILEFAAFVHCIIQLYL